MLITTKSITQFAVALTITCGLSACSNYELKPWVKAHEREILSSDIMLLERDPISTRYMNHVYESREGARGAEGSAGGGCGCN